MTAPLYTTLLLTPGWLSGETPGFLSFHTKTDQDRGSQTLDGNWGPFGLRTLLLAGAGVLSTREMTPNRDAEQSSPLS